MLQIITITSVEIDGDPYYQFYTDNDNYEFYAEELTDIISDQSSGEGGTDIK